MTDPALRRDRERFKVHLQESANAVWRVTRHFHMSGFDICMKAYTAFGPYEKRMEEIDNGDLYVRRDKNPWERVEVKQRKLDFTDSFPYPTMFVCACHSWDNADPQPVVIIYPNRTLTHFAYLFTDTSDRWTKRKVSDRRYEAMNQDTYCVDTSMVRFRSFDELWA